MPQNIPLYKEMLVKRTIWSELIVLIAWAGFAMFMLTGTQRRLTLLHPATGIIWLFTACLIIIPFLCLYRLLFTRLQAKITQEGIWTRKGKMFLWKDIWYVNAFMVEGHKGTGYYLNIRLKDEAITNGPAEVRIKVLDRTEKPQDIYNLVMQYAEENNIINLGNTVVPMDRPHNELL